jgi:hypothetical protein
VGAWLVWAFFVAAYLAVLWKKAPSEGNPIVAMWHVAPPVAHVAMPLLALVPAFGTRAVLYVRRQPQSKQVVARRVHYACGIPLASARVDLSQYQSVRIRETWDFITFLRLDAPGHQRGTPREVREAALERWQLATARYTVTLSGYRQRPIVLVKRASLARAQAVQSAICQFVKFDVV